MRREQTAVMRKSARRCGTRSAVPPGRGSTIPRASLAYNGAAGALELAGNIPSFQDRVCHATINVDNLDPECALDGLVANQPQELERVNYILNNSFGMLGINSVLIIRRF